MAIRYDQANIIETAAFQAFEKALPGSIVFRVGNIEPNDFPDSVGPDRKGQHECLGYDPVILSGFEIRCVNHQKRYIQVVQRTVPEGIDLCIKFLA